MRVSITLVTRNGIETLPALLSALDEQNTHHEAEIVAIDSASDDGSAELLEKHSDVFESIDPKAFNHGATRNRALELGSGEAAVLLVQDAIPATTDWLENLIAPIEDDPTVAGAYARQLPRKEATAFTRWNLSRWAGAEPERRVSRLASPDELQAMAPLDRLHHCTFDNVCSCIRRSVWEQYRFPATQIAEDLSWAKEVLLAGHRIVYQPAAEVFHSHERSLAYELDRTTAVHRRLYTLFGVRTVPNLRCFLRSVASTLEEHVRVVSEGPRSDRSTDMTRAVGLAVVWPLGQYLGGRAGRRDALKGQAHGGELV